MKELNHRLWPIFSRDLNVHLVHEASGFTLFVRMKNYPFYIGVNFECWISLFEKQNKLF